MFHRFRVLSTVTLKVHRALVGEGILADVPPFQGPLHSHIEGPQSSGRRGHSSICSIVSRSSPQSHWKSTKKRLLASTFSISLVNLTYFVFWNNFCIRILWLIVLYGVDRSRREAPVIDSFSCPSSKNRARFNNWLVQDFLGLKPASSGMRCWSTKEPRRFRMSLE